MTALPRTAPSEQQVDAAGISAFLQRVRDEDLELHSLMVARHGVVIAEGWWEPYSASQVHQFYSVTKTFTASCVGSLVDEGLVDLERPVVEYFDWLGVVDEKLQRLTVRHCLNMATGHRQEAWREEYRTLTATNEHDPLVRQSFTLVPDGEPGTVFCYNQIATYLLGAVVREVTGRPMLEELRRRILDPLGIDEFHMKTTPLGNELGFTGGHGNTEALLRLGLLYLGQGIFDGHRVLSQEWIDQATTFVLPDTDASADWSLGYGFQLWKSQHGFRGDGAFGQLMLVLPEHDMVIATTAQEGNIQAVLTAIWETILPAVGQESGAHPDQTLAQELEALRFTPLVSTGEPGTHDYWRRGPDSLPGDWTGLCLRPSQDGATLLFEGVDVTVDVGDGQWSHSHWDKDGNRMALAASGGWRDGEFEAEIRVLHTSHTMRLTTHDETFTLNWVTDPLNSQDPLFYHLIPAPDR